MIAPTLTSTPTESVVPLASADQIHTFLVETFRIGNRARLRFARLLAALSASRQYLQLGHPSIMQYAERHFGMQRSETYEHLRVADKIDELPVCLEAFEDGKLSWSALKQVTRVAKSNTEEPWLAFAGDRTYAELRAEVQDAVQKQRAEPRSDRYGLPNLTVKFTLELTLEEQERLKAALEKVGAEIAPALGQEQLKAKDVLLYLTERFLKTDSGGVPEGREEGGDSPYTILYHQCPGCRRTRLMTGDGPVEVEPESVDRLGGDANQETLDEGIDRPNSAALARRVKLRDGGRCQNPGCGWRGDLHAHHIQYRSHGGRTVAANEVAVCTRCHALIHAGLLRIIGDIDAGLEWRPRSTMITVESGNEVSALMEVPVARTVFPNAASTKTASVITDTVDLEAVSGVLERLGLSRREARVRVERSWSQLEENDQALDEGRILTQALRAS